MADNFFSRLSSELKVSLVGYCGAFFLWALRKTLNIKLLAPQNQSKTWAQDSQRILVFWHSQQLMMPWIYLDSSPASKRRPIVALISKSLDGRFIAKAIKILGIDSVAGSSSRGGKEALIQLVRFAQQGSHIAITPDGPKGPAQKIKVGALKVAQLTGVKIYPSSFAATHYWKFNSWDNMILPKPFSTAVIMTGEPIEVPRESSEAEVTELSEKLEMELNRITRQAQAELGYAASVEEVTDRQHQVSNSSHPDC